MKALVVFYSLEGHTKFIASVIAKELKCDLLELQPEKEIPKTGFKKFFWGGKSAIFKEKPSLKNKIPDLEQYDTIFLGTPIWAGTYAPPINTFISDNEIKQKNIAFFACHSGGGAKKCFGRLQDFLKDNNIVGSIDFIDPKSDDEEKKSEIKNWLNDIIMTKLN
ncbi:flavodoxin family protein [Clostridium neuense]|uniref:Flavodoxin family protein n=1 Tax=Clostridium neuense TaxID=1728934 RepID=A0ABW8TER7_9CLOT